MITNPIKIVSISDVDNDPIEIGAGISSNGSMDQVHHRLISVHWKVLLKEHLATTLCKSKAFPVTVH
jgi:hypothetical protein